MRWCGAFPVEVHFIQYDGYIEIDLTPGSVILVLNGVTQVCFSSTPDQARENVGYILSSEARVIKVDAGGKHIRSYRSFRTITDTFQAQLLVIGPIDQH